MIQLLFYVIGAFSGSAIASAQSGLDDSTSCSLYPPVSMVSGVFFYSDSAGSITNPEKAMENDKALRNVRDFMFCIEQAVDRATDTKLISGAYDALRKWALANALNEPPDNREGRVERVFMAAGFGLIVLKFKFRGQKPDPVINHWYSLLAGRVRVDYAHFDSNVYPWAGVSSAISALLSGDNQALQFADEAWKNSTNRISQHGTLKPELARGARALIYHQAAASGMLVLRRLRQALGASEDPAEVHRLQALMQFVGQSLCQPEEIETLVGARQELPGAWGYRVAFGFEDGLVPSQWHTCGPSTPDYNAIDAGGDTRISREAVDFAAVKRSAQ